jgi:hypothetical protein
MREPHLIHFFVGKLNPQGSGSDDVGKNNR